MGDVVNINQYRKRRQRRATQKKPKENPKSRSEQDQTATPDEPGDSEGTSLNTPANDEPPSAG
jgi:DNA replication protein DnaD